MIIVPKKEVKHSTGKIIDVYDDLFSYRDVLGYWKFITRSLYMIDEPDNFAMPLELKFYSLYSWDDTKLLGFTNHPSFLKLDEKYNFSQYQLVQCRINLSTPHQKNRIHTDEDGLTLVYYVNPKWDFTWGGHTLFMDDLLQEAEYTCIYKPGRVVIFDGTIPHMIMNESSLCPDYRLTFAIQWRKNPTP
nr:prolyl hydroxylase homologue [uncultured Mediterranean phage uvMED]